MPVSLEDVRRALGGDPPGPASHEVGHRAAVALILRERDAGLELLFIRRADQPEDPWSGQMAFPGGRSEPGDPDLRVTAMRETREEIGLDLATWGACLGSLAEVRAVARLRPLNLAIAPFVFRLDGDPPPLLLSSEVRSVHWLPLDDLLGTARRSVFDYTYQETTLQFPCLRVDDVVIWGLTYRMFASLQALLAPPAGQAEEPR